MITILQNKDVTDRILFEMKDGDDIYGTVSGIIDGNTIVADISDTNPPTMAVIAVSISSHCSA